MHRINLRSIFLAAVVMTVWTGCAARQQELPALADGPVRCAENSAEDHVPIAQVFALTSTDGVVLIEWNGLALTTLIDAVGKVTGRVIVYDRRQVELKPPIWIARALQVPIDGIYPLFESVLAYMQLAGLSRTLPLTPLSTWEVVRVVRREESGNVPFEEPHPDLWSGEDIPWLAVAGPTGPAAAVRARLVRRLKPSDRPSPVPLSPALLRARYGSAAHSTGRDGHFDPNLCDLTIFDSPYPQCVR